jgi:hypothetical protein
MHHQAPQLLTLDDVAARLAISRRSVERLVSRYQSGDRSGLPACYPTAGRPRVSESALSAYIAAKTPSPRASTR